MKFPKIILTAMLSVMTSAAAHAISPEEEIREWCDSNILQDVEGIWEYPDDNTRVWIKADKMVAGSYTISVINTADCRISSGDIIGRLYPSISTKQFRLEQWTRKDDLSFIKPLSCTAILSSDGETLRIKSPKLKLKINPTTLLPRFWRLVRISVDNPADELPAGLIKIYPGYDHNGSLRRKPRIL